MRAMSMPSLAIEAAVVIAAAMVEDITKRD
jgi:hypothetical protein